MLLHQEILAVAAAVAQTEAAAAGDVLAGPDPVALK